MSAPHMTLEEFVHEYAYAESWMVHRSTLHVDIHPIERGCYIDLDTWWFHRWNGGTADVNHSDPRASRNSLCMWMWEVTDAPGERALHTVNSFIAMEV